MRILELRKGSAEEAELLEAAAATHGPWVQDAARLLDRMLLMRSAWAPGLRYVGGMARTMTAAGGMEPALSVGGAGFTLEDAVAGCLGEAVERLSQIERDGDIVLTAPIEDVRVPDQIGELIDLIRARDVAPLPPIDWVRARSCTTGDEALVPADWCLRRAKPLALEIPGGALSTGSAAATALDDATARGLLELIERDAASLWWHAIRGAAALGNGRVETAAAARIAGELRQGDGGGRRTSVIDITSDLGIPVMAAFSHQDDGIGFTLGLAARVSPSRAVSGALMELAQMELGLQLALGKREQIGETALTSEDRRHLTRAAVPIAELTPLAASEPPRRFLPLPADAGPLRPIVDVLERAGIEAWCVNLSRPDGGPAVAKVIAPRLQPMPGDVVTARLRAGPIRPCPIPIV